MATAVTESQDLIPELCRQFEQMTGWRLLFTPAGPELAEVQARFQKQSPPPWFAEIGNGSRTAGLLHLEPSDDIDRQLPFAEATCFADTLSRMLEQLAVATFQLNSRNRDVSTLLNLGLAVPAQDNLAFALSQLLKAAVHLTGTRSAAFFLLDSTTSNLRLRAVHQLTREEMPFPQRELRASKIDLQALADQPVIIELDNPGEHPLLPKVMRAGMCVGVQSETGPFGTLWVYDRRFKTFSQRDMHVLQSIAAQVAAVLERSALLRGDERHTRIRRDLEAASEPYTDNLTADLPRDPRFEVAARCTSCYELGGDLCEVLPVGEDCTALAVGDASGNSIPAAMIMSAVRGAIRAHPAGAPDLIDLMERLNRALCSITHSHQFMSLCYGVFDAAERVFTYCNAGHPTPFLIRDGRVKMLESHGLLLGVLSEATYRHAELPLESGDILVMYSDGISEARSTSQAMFRGEGISSTILSLTDQSAAAILETVWDKVEQHIRGGEPGDDRTLLVLKVL